MNRCYWEGLNNQILTIITMKMSPIDVVEIAQSVRMLNQTCKTIFAVVIWSCVFVYYITLLQYEISTDDAVVSQYSRKVKLTSKIK